MANLAKDLEKLIDQKIEKDKWERCNLPERYKELPKFIADSGNAEALKLTEKFIRDEIGGIVYIGRAGTGKTLLAATALHRSDWDSARFVGVPRLLAELRDNYKDPTKSNMLIVDNLINCELLVLDDLGAEKVTDWTTEILYLIINGRYENKRRLIVTTNCSPIELAKRTGDRIVSRLAEMCEIANITSKDRRLLKWQK